MNIIAPIKTEKAIGKIEYENALTFRVKLDANKDTIKKEVESLFGVKVVSVNVQITFKGKKQAVVKLAKEFKADDVAAKLKMIA
jgi:large subunit ribosomal protein L23